MSIKKIIFLGVIVLTGSLICLSDSSIATFYEQELLVVNEKEAQTDGYPLNDYGESFGPDMKDNISDEPDLIFALNELGQEGYLKKSDFSNDGEITLEDARNSNPQTYSIPMYKDDGRTMIGWFTIGNGKK